MNNYHSYKKSFTLKLESVKIAVIASVFEKIMNRP